MYGLLRKYKMQMQMPCRAIVTIHTHTHTHAHAHVHRSGANVVSAESRMLCHTKPCYPILSQSQPRPNPAAIAMPKFPSLLAGREIIVSRKYQENIKNT
jgi:hypothetical protein